MSPSKRRKSRGRARQVLVIAVSLILITVAVLLIFQDRRDRNRLEVLARRQNDSFNRGEQHRRRRRGSGKCPYRKTGTGSPKDCPITRRWSWTKPAKAVKPLIIRRRGGIPPRRAAENSTAGSPLKYDRELDKRRNDVERLFCKLEGFRRIYTRFEKLGYHVHGLSVTRTHSACYSALTGPGSLLSW